jgi:hypothetical protein
LVRSRRFPIFGRLLLGFGRRGFGWRGVLDSNLGVVARRAGGQHEAASGFVGQHVAGRCAALDGDNTVVALRDQVVHVSANALDLACFPNLDFFVFGAADDARLTLLLRLGIALGVALCPVGAALGNILDQLNDVIPTPSTTPKS